MSGGAGSRLGGALPGSGLAQVLDVGGDPTPDVHYYRHAGDAYSWGRHTWETLNSGNYILVPNVMICLPQIVARPCTVATLLFKNLGAAGAGVRFAIYANRAEGVLYPGVRLWQSDDYSPTFLQAVAMAPALTISEAGLYWLVIQAPVGSNAVETRGQNSNEMLVLGGLASTAWSTNDQWQSDATIRPFVGWTIPQTYAAGLPSEAPTGVSEARLLTHNAAGIGYPLPSLGVTFGGLVAP